MHIIRYINYKIFLIQYLSSIYTKAKVNLIEQGFTTGSSQSPNFFLQIYVSTLENFEFFKIYCGSHRYQG